MGITVEAIYEAGVLKPLTPLSELPEHTKVRITVEAIAGIEPRGRVIDEQRRHRLSLNVRVARAIGDGHEYDMLES
jgi:predicted DNA-binding antitoxin AbrB/MazE fold protein